MAPDTQQRAPGLLSFSRITTLVVAVLAALCSGTNYVYSAYAPQLGARLGLTHTQLNMVGLSGNMGVYSTAAVIGKLVDAEGPRIPLVMAIVFLFSGYLGIKSIYDAGSGHPISTITFVILILCTFLTGVGGNGGLSSAVKPVAKSFPDKFRATTTGIVLSGFGLSAFLFSTIAHAVFPGNTSDFLLVLAIGTSLPMIPGYFFIREIPLPGSSNYHCLESDDENHEHDFVDVSTSSGLEREHARLLEDQDSEQTEQRHHHYHQQESPRVMSNFLHSDVQLSSALWEIEHRSLPRRTSLDDSAVKLIADVDADAGLINLSGRALFATVDFWLLFTIMSLLSGTGLMWINNVGSIVQALLAKDNPDYGDSESSRWQSIQVSTVSIMNCTGRIFVGIIADLVKTRLRRPRAYCILLVTSLFLASQVLAIQTSDVEHLYKASAMLGFAYGGMFGLFPTISMEWFGLPHFSENWGLLSLSPLIGGNLFSLVFGWNLDANSHAGVAVSPSPSSSQCTQGVQCYTSSLYMTAGACLLASVLGVWAGWRDRRKQLMHSSPNIPEVVWDQDT